MEGRVDQSQLYLRLGYLKCHFWRWLCLGSMTLGGCACDSTPERIKPPVKELAKAESQPASPAQSKRAAVRVTVNGTCQVDTAGLVQSTGDSKRLGKVRRQSWRREESLKLSPDRLALLPSLETIPQIKMVSFEVSAGSSGGHPKPGFECIRWRLLSEAGPANTKDAVRKSFGLAIRENGVFEGTVPVGTLQVSVGTNGRDVTQIDFALVPKLAVPTNFSFGVESPLLTWLRGQSMSGFEYGVYISGRKGLKFPGLERAVVLTGVERVLLERKLGGLGFVVDEKHPHVFVNSTRTVTSRRYEQSQLSVFWQSRLNQKATSRWFK